MTTLADIISQDDQAVNLECSVVGKPAAGENSTIMIDGGQAVSFNFTLDDVSSMATGDNGALLITFNDGSVLVVENFADIAGQSDMAMISFADGRSLNVQKLSEALSVENEIGRSTDTVAENGVIKIVQPTGAIGATQLTIDMVAGETYELAFEADQVASMMLQAGDLVIRFKDGSEVILNDFETVSNGDVPAAVTLADGNVIEASELILVLSDLAGLEEITETQVSSDEVSGEEAFATIEPAAGEPQVQQVAEVEIAPEELAAIEPAAGPAAAGGNQNTGAGFGSNVQDNSLSGLSAIGPIGPTALQFAQPSISPDPLAAPAASALPPSLAVADVETYEDTDVDLGINASPNGGANEFLTIVIEDIPLDWTVTGTGVRTGTTYTITLNPGESLTGGPVLTPPADSDGDITVNVTVTATETSSGDTSSVSDSVDVLVDAVADAPNLDAQDATGFEDVDLPLNIDVSLNDTDGSEEITQVLITGVPSGFSFNSGVNLGGGTWQIDPADLDTLVVTPPANYSGTETFGLEVTVTEVNLSGGEITTSNNQVTEVTDFDVTFVAVADAPSLVANNPIVKEDGTIPLEIEATLADDDGSEFLTVTVTGIDTSWGVDANGGTYNSSTGTWTITLPAGQNFTGGPIFTPPADSDVDMTNLTVTATSTETSNSSSQSANAVVDVLVDAVADAPLLDADDASGMSGTPIALTISAALTDTDGSEVLSNITLSGVPTGFTFSAGTDMGGGVWEFTQAELVGLTVTPTAGYSGTVNFDVSVTSTEQVTDGEVDLTDNEATSTDTITLNVVGAPEAPTIDIAGEHQVYEDGSVSVPLDVTLNGSGNEVLTVTVTGLDPAWTITNTDGTFSNGGTTWTITLPAGTDYSGAFTFMPPADSDLDLTGITVTATATVGSSSETSTEGTSVVVDAVADAPALTADDAAGDAGDAIALDITTALTDTDGSESLGLITISGVPAGATLSAGNDLGGGVWELTQAQLTNLTITTSNTFSGSFDLTVSVTSTEAVTDTDFDLTNNEATSTETLTVTVDAIAFPPTINVAGEHQVYEDGSVSVPLDVTLNGGGNEILTVTVTGLDPAWTITNTDGTFSNGGTTWTITLPAGTDYSGAFTFMPPADSDLDLTGITVTATSAVNGDVATATEDTSVVVDAVADAPTLDGQDASGDSGSSIALDITAGLTDTDGSETLSVVTISGVPSGFSLSAGTNQGGGVWQVSASDLTNLRLNTPNNYSGSFNLDLSVTSVEGVTDTDFDLTNNEATTTDTITISVDDAVNPPTLNVAGEHQVYEDGSIFVPIMAASNGSDREVLTVTVTGIDSSWTITNPDGTYDASTGTWTITLPANTDYNGGLTFAPPADSDVDMTGLTVTASAYEPSTGQTESVSENTTIVVDAVADAPTLATNNAIGLEGDPIALNISAGLTDTDGSETLGNIRISGIPSGTSLSAGTDLGGGVWELTQAELSGLQLLTTEGSRGTYNFTLSVTSTEQITDNDFDLTNNTATTTKQMTVTIGDAAVPPTLDVDGTHKVYEDGSVFVPFSATLNGSPNEILTVTVSGIDPSWTITNTDGTYNSATGTWTITLPAGTNYSGGLTFAPPADSDLDLTGINVKANAFVPSTGSNASVTEVIQIITDAVADAPALNANDASGDAGVDIPLTITTSLTDTDGSETLGNIRISGVPSGFTLSAGTDQGGGVWVLTKAQLSGLTIKSPANYDGNVNLTVSVTSTEQISDDDFDLTNNTATSTDTVTISINDPVDAPTLNVAGEHRVLEDGSVFVPIEAVLNGSSSETLTVTITGIDPAWGINNTDGTYNSATGTWTITLPANTDYNGGLTFAPPADSDVDLTGMVVTATATNSNGSVSTDANTSVIVDAVADVPTLNAQDTSGQAGSAIALNVSAALTDTDGSETLSNIRISGVPSGFSLSAGTNQGGGVWIVTPGQLSGLSLNTPNNYSGNVNLTVSVTSTEQVTDGEFNLNNNTATTTDTLTVTVSDQANAPTLNVAGVNQVLEDGSVFVPIEAVLNGSSREVLTVTVTGIDPSWTITNTDGTYNSATGTWTITLPANTDYNGGLTFAPPADSDVDMTGLVVTATATDGSDTATTSEDTMIIVDAVADAPTLNVQNASGLEGSAINLSIATALTDTDGSEVLDMVVISGLPSGFTLSAGSNQGGGVWHLTQAQLNNLKLNAPNGYDGTFTLNVRSTSRELVTDEDFNLNNNTASTSRNLTVTVIADDVPDFTTIPTPMAHETDLVNGTETVTGTVTADFGADGPGTYGITTAGSFTVGGSLLNGNLTSCGEPITLSTNGNSYVGTANGQTIFTLTLNANGSFQFQLFEAIDHGNPNSDSENINLNFQISATDSDGDTTTGTLTIQVQDSGPTAVSDTAYFATCDGVVNGNAISGFVGYQNNNAAAQDDTMSGDDTWLASVTDGNGTVHSMPDNGVMTIQGEYGNLFIFANGTYFYIQEVAWGTPITDSFQYTLQDCDGDTSTANLVFQGIQSDVTFNPTARYAGNGTSAAGDSGSNFVTGGDNNDTLNGYAGDDMILGWNGNDTIYGGSGNDLVGGEQGMDTLYGGAGSDIFLGAYSDSLNGNYDTIKDFNLSQGDTLAIEDVLSGYNGTQDPNNFVRFVNSGNGSFLQINADGQGNDWNNIFYIENNTNLNVDDLIASGNLDLM